MQQVKARAHHGRHVRLRRQVRARVLRRDAATRRLHTQRLRQHLRQAGQHLQRLQEEDTTNAANGHRRPHKQQKAQNHRASCKHVGFISTTFISLSNVNAFSLILITFNHSETTNAANRTSTPRISRGQRSKSSARKPSHRRHPLLLQQATSSTASTRRTRCQSTPIIIRRSTSRQSARPPDSPRRRPRPRMRLLQRSIRISSSSLSRWPSLPTS